MTKFVALITGHIWKDDVLLRDEDIEILQIIEDGDRESHDIFDDVEGAILDTIDIGNSEDYHFTVLVEAEYVSYTTWEGTEYDTEYDVEEIKDLKDIVKFFKQKEEENK